MTYSISDYQAYLEKLEKIQEIDWVKNHLYLMKKPNLWTILVYGKEQVKSKVGIHWQTHNILMILVDLENLILLS